MSEGSSYTERLEANRMTEADLFGEDMADVEYHVDGSETIHIDPSATGATGVAYANHSACGEPGHYCPTGEHPFIARDYTQPW